MFRCEIKFGFFLSDSVVDTFNIFLHFEDEDMALRVAEAPSVAVNRVATYRELDSDLLRHVAFATIDDIDLRLLTKGKSFLMSFL